jgi:hypothetical protein
MKCIIITTINASTQTIDNHISNPNYDVIIVGDKKTPDCYYNMNCIYLDIKKQHELFPEISKLIPYNHYARKNIGYLYAIQNNYNIIYETDDDNIPLEHFDDNLNFDNDNIQLIEQPDCEWINIFKYFTNNAWIWPRGYPLSLIQKENKPNFIIKPTNIKPSIINGLVKNDPDVDAIFRLTNNSNNNITWEDNKKIVISNKNICVFNTQNTFWVDKDIFCLLLIPSSVSFRYCDILKGIIANVFLRTKNKNIAYISPNVIQLRNEHNLITDFRSEYSMYITNENILNYIYDDIDNTKNDKELMLQIYKNLLNNNVITDLDMLICNEWLKYF